MKIKYLSPSRAHRWWECAGSVRAEAIAPIVEGNSYALEGTAAHKLFELCLRRKVEAETFIGDTIRLVRDKTDWAVTEEMAEHIQAGIDVVRRRLGKGTLWLEKEVHVKTRGAITGGTLDAGWYGRYVVAPNESKRRVKPGSVEWQLHILDLKYGMLLVEAHDNKQLQIYARGLLRELEVKGKRVDSVHLWIYQPRLMGDGTPFQHVVLEPYELHEFQGELQDKVNDVLKPRAPLKAGPWCLYCNAHAVCPEAERAALRLARSNFRDADTGRVGELLFKVKEVLAWCKAVRDLGNAMKNAGKPPLLWKVVAGNKRKRWPGGKEPAAQIKAVLPKLIKLGLKRADLVSEKLQSPAAVLRLLPKEKREKLAGIYVETRDGDRLVPEDDARQAVSAGDYFENEGDDGQYD